MGECKVNDVDEERKKSFVVGVGVQEEVWLSEEGIRASKEF